jgi:Flp pilus assembly pilin Flp
VFFHALRRSDQELTKNYFPKETTMNSIKNFLKDETGIETMEYAIIAAIVAAVALLVYGSGWGQAIHDKLVNAANTDTSGVGL